MPSTYTHYRFGKEVITCLPSPYRKPIEKYRDLYNEAVKKYVEEYGPLNYRQSKAEKSWDWTDGKWPWEKED